MPIDDTTQPSTLTARDRAAAFAATAVAVAAVSLVLYRIQRASKDQEALVKRRVAEWDAGRQERLVRMQQQALLDAAKEAEFRARASAFKQARTA